MMMTDKSVLVVCLSPAFQQTSIIENLRENGVNRSRETLVTCSGKGINVSRVLGKLGTPSVNLTQLGGERIGEFLSLCEKAGVKVRYVDSHAHIRNCVTLVSEHGGTSTEIVEENPPVPESINEDLLAVFRDEMPKHDALVITGSMAKGFRSDIFALMTAEAKRLGKKVILDTRGKTLIEALPARPDIIKPNLDEFLKTFSPGNSINEHDESEHLFPLVEKKAEELWKAYGTKCIITRGADDTWFFDGEELCREKARKVKAVNTIGCGDTFTAALVSSMLEGKDMRECVRLAMDEASSRAERKELI